MAKVLIFLRWSNKLYISLQLKHPYRHRFCNCQHIGYVMSAYTVINSDDMQVESQSLSIYL
jgi:hypothetical protein